MGDTLDRLPLESFSDELAKIAAVNWAGALKSQLNFSNILKKMKAARRAQGVNGFIGNVQEAGNRVFHPIEGLKAGWRDSSPLAGLERRAKEMGFASPQQAAEKLRAANTPEAGKQYKKLMGGGGEHLLGTDPSAGKVRGIAEEFSRRGWTGAGKRTKYLPVGMKSMTVGFSGLTIPGMVNAPEATPTGEGGFWEQGLGELGGMGGMIAGTGLGFVPGVGLWQVGKSTGGRLGRTIDRMRAGASVRDAFSAPSPTEAQEQAANLQKYYGLGAQ